MATQHIFLEYFHPELPGVSCSSNLTVACVSNGWVKNHQPEVVYTANWVIIYIIYIYHLPPIWQPETAIFFKWVGEKPKKSFKLSSQTHHHRHIFVFYLLSPLISPQRYTCPHPLNPRNVTYSLQLAFLHV